MSVWEKESQIRHYRMQLSAADQAYWDDEKPLVTDTVYDAMVQKFEALSGERWEKVLGDPGKVPHTLPMLSLQKAYTPETISSWFHNLTLHIGNIRDLLSDDEPAVSVTPKYDGVSLEVRYLDGEPQYGVTRGDGEKGELIPKSTLRYIESIPRSSDLAPLTARGEPILAVRGEVVVPTREFESGWSDQFANPRNMAAGLLRRGDTSILEPGYEDGGLLKFYPYSAIVTKGAGGTRNILYDTGETFLTKAEVLDPAKVGEVIQKILSADHNVGLDGVVFRIIHPAYFQGLGDTAHHPRGAIAFKPTDAREWSILKKVTWEVSRTGRINPVAHIAPTTVSGAEISRISLHNQGLIEALVEERGLYPVPNHDIALYEGDIVEISRRGGVIPHIERVQPPEMGGRADERQGFPPPTHCPECGGITSMEGAFWTAHHKNDCVPVLVGKLEHYCSTMEIMGMGPETLHTLVMGGVKSIPELYDFDWDRAGAETFGEITAKKLAAELEKSKSKECWRYLAALGLYRIGGTTAKRVAKDLPDWESVLAVLDTMPSSRGFNHMWAEVLSMKMEDYEAALQLPLRPDWDLQGDVPKPADREALKYVVTGALTKMKRREAEAYVEDKGWELQSSVTEQTRFLVAPGEDVDDLRRRLASGDKPEASASSKIKRAFTLIKAGASIEIITEEDFWDRVDG